MIATTISKNYPKTTFEQDKHMLILYNKEPGVPVLISPCNFMLSMYAIKSKGLGMCSNHVSSTRHKTWWNRRRLLSYSWYSIWHFGREVQTKHTFYSINHACFDMLWQWLIMSLQEDLIEQWMCASKSLFESPKLHCGGWVVFGMKISSYLLLHHFDSFGLTYTARL